MPYKDREEYNAYMRAYRQRRARKPEHKPEEPAPELVAKADPEHLRRLAQAVGMAVATPRGRGTLLHVSQDHATVAVAGAAVVFPSAQVGLW
ncbi:MAG: hypothetical protein GX492_05250 [Firmicutes bacterium]|nr:hypothetical protein [Bacillota bacterium]HHY33915.1 hypothetical protein [Bacillota bacterium]